MTSRHAVARTLLTVLAAGTLAGFGGCVSQKEYDSLESANRSKTESITRLTAREQQALQERDLAISERDRERQLRQAAQAEVTRLNAAVAGADQKYADLLRRLDAASVMPVDPETDRALANLAAQNPNLIQYDRDRGMLRFASDLTFDSGSDVVKAEARQSLAALANVLNQQSALAYEIQIVGHTDSQPISAGTAQRHPTNMHLSCHRAISVRRELIGLGVPAGRIMAAGWGEERPLVPNTARGNTPQNRRVEIFLTRAQGSFQPGTPANQNVGVDRTAPPPRPGEINK